MKIIKRYANRKLYDTERSCYVTLDEIADMVREGIEIKIVDQKTDEDLTSVTLTQIIFEEEKRSRRILPLPALRSIIQSGGDFLQRVTQPVQQFKEDTQRSVDRLLRQPGERIDEGKQNLRELATSITRTIDEMQTKVDDRVRAAVDNLTHVPELQDQVAEVRAHLDRVDERLTQIERMIDRLWDASPPGDGRWFGRV
jgi:polyhydroxyalkanoate synthesis repressor PhaR